MSRTCNNLSRRAVLAQGGAIFASAVLPFGPSEAAVAASPFPPVSLKKVSVFYGNLTWVARAMSEVRKLRIEAEERYRSTGDSHAIVELRARAMHRFGFALGREARNDVERALFLEARDLLAELEAEVPEVPWSSDWKERFSVLKGWAEAGGQWALDSYGNPYRERQGR